MIIKCNNKTIAIVVPQKCGISTVTNILAYNLTGQPRSKTKCRRVLRHADCLVNPGQLEEIFFIEWCNPSPDYVFAVVRDPVERLFSAYRDRVFTKNTDKLPDTSWNYFCETFKDLVLYNTDVGKHCRPQVHWLGLDASKYDKIFYTHEINTRFKPIIENIIAQPIPNMLENTSKELEIDISDSQLAFFSKYYKQDFDFISCATELGKFI